MQESNGMPKMNLLASFVLLIAGILLALPLRWIMGDFMPPWIFGLVALLLTPAVNHFIGRFEDYLQRNEVSKHALDFSGKTLFNPSFDISILFLVASYLSVFFVALFRWLFESSITAKQITFPEGGRGDVALLELVSVTVVLCSFATIYAIYGFLRGFYNREFQFRILLVSSFIGYLSYLLMYVVLGGQIFTEAMYIAFFRVKEDSPLLFLPWRILASITIIFVTSLVICGYIWLFEMFGKGCGWLYRKWQQLLAQRRDSKVVKK